MNVGGDLSFVRSSLSPDMYSLRRSYAPLCFYSTKRLALMV
jgi:hypothetical protein